MNLIKTKISIELSNLSLNSNVIPLIIGCSHNIKTDLSCLPPNFHKTKESELCHTLCNFNILKCNNKSTTLTFDYKYNCIRFIKKGMEINTIPFDKIKKVVRDTCESIIKPDRINISNPSCLTLKDIGIDIDLNTEFPIDEATIIESSRYTDSHSTTRKSNAHSVLTASSIDEEAQDTISNTSIRSFDSADLSELGLTFEIVGQSPIKFSCASLNQRDHIFNRMKAICADVENSLKNSNEHELILHRCLAKRPTRSGLFYKRVLLIVIPGRVLEYEYEDPIEIKPSPSDDPSLAQYRLNYKNICVKEVITLFNTHPPSINSSNKSVSISTFVPNFISSEFIFTTMEEAELFFKASSFCRDAWDYQEFCYKVVNTAQQRDSEENRRNSHISQKNDFQRLNYERVRSQQFFQSLRVKSNDINSSSEHPPSYGESVKTNLSSPSNRSRDLMTIYRVKSSDKTELNSNGDSHGTNSQSTSRRPSIRSSLRSSAEDLKIYKDPIPVFQKPASPIKSTPLVKVIPPLESIPFYQSPLILSQRVLQTPPPQTTEYIDPKSNNLELLALYHNAMPPSISSNANSLLLAVGMTPHTFSRGLNSKPLTPNEVSLGPVVSTPQSKLFSSKKLPVVLPIKNNPFFAGIEGSRGSLTSHKFQDIILSESNSNLARLGKDIDRKIIDSSRSSLIKTTEAKEVLDSFSLKCIPSIISWSNRYLIHRSVRVESIKDFANGIYLISLFESIFQIIIPVQEYQSFPKNLIHKATNVKTVLKYLNITIGNQFSDKKPKLHIDAYNGADFDINSIDVNAIIGGKEVAILKLLQMILSVSIKFYLRNDCAFSKFKYGPALLGDEHLNTLLINWCQCVIDQVLFDAGEANFKINVDDMYDSFSDGKGFCLIVHYINPNCGIIVNKVLEGSFNENLTLAFSSAEEYVEVDVFSPEYFMCNRIITNEIVTFLCLLISAYCSNNNISIGKLKLSNSVIPYNSKLELDLDKKNLVVPLIRSSRSESILPHDNTLKSPLHTPRTPNSKSFTKTIQVNHTHYFVFDSEDGKKDKLKIISSSHVINETSIDIDLQKTFGLQLFVSPLTSDSINIEGTAALTSKFNEYKSKIVRQNSMNNIVTPKNNIDNNMMVDNLVDNLILSKKKLLAELEVIELQLANLKSAKAKPSPRSQASPIIAFAPKTNVGENLMQNNYRSNSKSSTSAQSEYISKALSGNEFCHNHVLSIWNDYELSVEANNSYMMNLSIDSLIHLCDRFTIECFVFLVHRFTSIKHTSSTLFLLRKMLLLFSKFEPNYFEMGVNIFWDIIEVPSSLDTLVKCSLDHLREVIVKWAPDTRFDCIVKFISFIKNGINILPILETLKMFLDSFPLVVVSGKPIDRTAFIVKLELECNIFDILIMDLNRFKERYRTASLLGNNGKKISSLIDGYNFNDNSNSRLSLLQYLIDNGGYSFDNENSHLISDLNENQKKRLARVKNEVSVVLSENSLSSSHPVRRRSTFVLNNTVEKSFLNHDLYSPARKSSLFDRNIDRNESILFRRKESLTPSIPTSPPAGSPPPIAMIRYKK